METKELTLLKTQVSKLENQVNEITIATPEENTAAIEIKAKLKEVGKTIKDRKEEITKPLNAALKSARDLFAPLEDQFENAENIVGRKLLAYKQKIDAEARAKEAKIAADLESGKIKKLETAERKIENIERVEKTTQTTHGQVQFRKIQKMRIVNTDLIPDMYWKIDEVLLRRDVLSGVVVPGAEKYEEETV